MAKLDYEVIDSKINRAILKQRRNKDVRYQAYLFIKRLIDIFISLLGLILTLPIMLIVAIAIKIETPGPIIFKQVRLGLDGKEFTIYKFRSMVKNAEAKTGPVWAKKNDSRITKVGHFIRRRRIDELPQFVNILKGEMSLVGPRPERPVFVEKFSKNCTYFRDRLLIKPGMTGLAQVTGGYDLNPRQKARLDLFYIRKQKLILDIRIVLKTVAIVILGDGAR